MKKTLSVLAIATLCLSFVLVGCGDNSGAGASSDQSAGDTKPTADGGAKPAGDGSQADKAPAPTPGPQ